MALKEFSVFMANHDAGAANIGNAKVLREQVVKAATTLLEFEVSKALKKGLNGVQRRVGLAKSVVLFQRQAGITMPKTVNSAFFNWAGWNENNIGSNPSPVT